LVDGSKPLRRRLNQAGDGAFSRGLDQRTRGLARDAQGDMRLRAER
jgi:hypothetical protein